MANVRLINTNAHQVRVTYSGGTARLGAGEVTPTIDDASALAVALDAVSGVRPTTGTEAADYDSSVKGQYDPDFTPSGGPAPDYELPVRDGVETAVQHGLGPAESFVHGPKFGLETLSNAQLATRAAQVGVAAATIDGGTRTEITNAIIAIEGAQPLPEFPV